MLGGNEVAILVPVLGRPHRVQPLIDSVEACTPESHRTLFIANDDDQHELLALEAAGAQYMTVPPPGTYPVKINAGYRATTEPFLFLAADDLAFRPCWLGAALDAMHGGAQVVGTNDLYNPRVLAGEHSTHSLVRRSYIDRHGTATDPGQVLHEQYHHWYCDDEFIETAKARGVYAHAHRSIVEHLHPFAGKAEMDATYKHGRRRTRRDRDLFYQRRRLWKSPSLSQPSVTSSGRN